MLACRRVKADGLFVPPIAWRLQVPVARLAKTRRPWLVFRRTHRIMRGFAGRERLPNLAPVPPARRIARLGGWDVIVSRRPRPCLSVPRHGV